MIPSKIKYVQSTLDVKCLSPVLWQGHLKTSYSRWGFCGEVAGEGEGGVLEGGRVSTLTSDPIYFYQNFDPAPRSWYITERGRAGGPGLPPSMGIECIIRARSQSPHRIPLRGECNLLHASKPADAPVSTIWWEGEAFSPLCSALSSGTLVWCQPGTKVTRISL